jgi:DNA-binding response OmpR family regulator
MGSLSFAGCSVLVVEDEPLIALELRHAFEARGAYVFAAAQLAQALTLAEHPDLSLAVLDYRIGAKTSADVCRRLEARGIPFLFYSGYDDMLDYWPDAVVVNKPTPAQVLIQKAAEVLRDRNRVRSPKLSAPRAYDDAQRTVTNP